MAVQPHRRSSEVARHPTLEEIARFRELEEARLLRVQGRLARQQLVRGQVEIGHRRLDLIWRFLLLGMMLISFVLALVGSLSLPAGALLVAGGLGGAGLVARKSGVREWEGRR
jgi:hypothetical protein